MSEGEMLVRSTARVAENIVYECGSAVREFDVGADKRPHDELAKVRRGNALQVDAGGAFALDNRFVNEGIADRAVIFAARRQQVLPGVNLCDQCSGENNVHGQSLQYGAQSPRRTARMKVAMKSSKRQIHAQGALDGITNTVSHREWRPALPGILISSSSDPAPARL